MIPDHDPHIKCINLQMIHFICRKKRNTEMVEESQLCFIQLLLGISDRKGEILTEHAQAEWTRVYSRAGICQQTPGGQKACPRLESLGA